MKNELLLLLDNSRVGYYPEREILPYDRFSTTDSIIQDRLKLLNSDKKNLKIVVTSCINLFEKLPSKNHFFARKQFRIGDSLSIKDLTAILEDLNYQRVDKVTSINEYTVRGGVVDFYSGFHKEPLRVDFFGDQIDLKEDGGDIVDEFEGLVQDPDGQVAQVSRICVTRRG